MSEQATKLLWAAFLFVALIVMGQLSKGEAQEQADWLTAYCTEAAIWAAEEARGVPLNQRTGQPDYRGIAEEHCPGMRPAAPAVSRQGFLDSSTDYAPPAANSSEFIVSSRGNAQPPVQIVQF
ncbi:hypothetical protein JJO83_13665 [Halomonas aquamarina]|uniref:hypothetical protein n=1 Tax=Vreelandella aquamarina TaxID=77097 RepID=UPI0023583518|nr:hypothetical protein [Halomonas aquamarina]MDC8443730.1 hypothetical protein [Halomonas aquamarina]